MKITATVKLNLRIPEAIAETEDSARLGLRDTIVAIARDAVEFSPVLTGHNRRSLVAEVSGMGDTVFKGRDSEPQRVVDDRKVQAAMYSTSGYGGHLEIGTSKMLGRRYIRTAYDLNIGDLAENIKKHLEAKGG